MTSFINLDTVSQPANVTFSSGWTYLPNLWLLTMQTSTIGSEVLNYTFKSTFYQLTPSE